MDRSHTRLRNTFIAMICIACGVTDSRAHTITDLAAALAAGTAQEVASMFLYTSVASTSESLKEEIRLVKGPSNLNAVYAVISEPTIALVSDITKSIFKDIAQDHIHKPYMPFIMSIVRQGQASVIRNGTNYISPSTSQATTPTTPPRPIKAAQALLGLTLAQLGGLTVTQTITQPLLQAYAPEALTVSRLSTKYPLAVDSTIKAASRLAALAILYGPASCKEYKNIACATVTIAYPFAKPYVDRAYSATKRHAKDLYHRIKGPSQAALASAAS